MRPETRESQTLDSGCSHLWWVFPTSSRNRQSRFKTHKGLLLWFAQHDAVSVAITSGWVSVEVTKCPLQVRLNQMVEKENPVDKAPDTAFKKSSKASSANLSLNLDGLNFLHCCFRLCGCSLGQGVGPSVHGIRLPSLKANWPWVNMQAAISHERVLCVAVRP